ncbi:MAG: hypothetical protein NT062_33260 [Proteobacteria bacterium]|nr:hypothetical protein [Pseudomonadota bacterium]
MSAETSWSALVHEIRLEPLADGPRLVAADWLTDRADPRGEYVVLACRAGLGPDDDVWGRRFDGLAEAHEVAWSAPLLALGAELRTGRTSLTFERGFVEHVTLRGAATRAFAQLCALEPITKLLVSNPSRELAAMPALAQVRELGLLAQPHKLLASPHLTGVETLGFGDFTRATAAALAASVVRPARLACSLDVERARILAASDVLARLAELARFELTDDVLVALAGAPLADLTTLELHAPRVTRRGLDALGPRLDQLVRLVYAAPLDHAFATHLATQLPSGALRSLDLACPAFDDGVIALLDAPACRHVEQLAVGDARVSPALLAALHRLAARGRLRQLRVAPGTPLALPGVRVVFGD